MQGSQQIFLETLKMSAVAPTLTAQQWCDLQDDNEVWHWEIKHQTASMKRGDRGEKWADLCNEAHAQELAACDPKAVRRQAMIEYLLRKSEAVDEQFEREELRRNELFVEAVRVCREQPGLVQVDTLSPEAQKVFASIVETGEGVRVRESFTALVVASLERVIEERESKEMINGVELIAESFRAVVSREFMTFKDFQRNLKTGQPDPTNPDNVRVFLKMQGTELRWNAWFQRQEIRELTSWGVGRTEGPWLPLTDDTLNRLMTHAGDSQYQFRPAENLFRRTVETIARETTYDPIIEHLVECEKKWDGLPRLVLWLSTACGVPCDPYHQAVGKNLIGAMVKRARKPGSKHDDVVIFQGPQGTFKSTLCRALAWQDQFFTDSIAFDGSPQNMIPQMFGKWLIELSELDGLANRETTFLKRFLSTTSDTVTLKYKALATDYPRRCVFIGTTNEDQVLRDATGNRRFFPVKIDRQINVAFVRENLNQLLGEAAHLESAGVDFCMPADLIPVAAAAQEAARTEAPHETFVNEWFGGDLGTLVTAADLATLLRDATGRAVSPNQVGVSMRRLGFVKTTARIDGKPIAAWRRGKSETARRTIVTRDGAGRLVPRMPFPMPDVSAVIAPLPGRLQD
jgi:predicted P-loop ATPase